MTLRRIIVRIIEVPMDAFFAFWIRLLCRHDWRKAEGELNNPQNSPIIGKMVVRGVCKKCCKEAWLSLT